MANVASQQPIKLGGANRTLLAVEVLIFVLPCYLIYMVCIPCAALGLAILVDMMIDAAKWPASEAAQDLRGFAPFALASITAFIGLPALIIFAKLLWRIFRGTIRDAPARASLARTLKWAVLPLIILTTWQMLSDDWWRQNDDIGFATAALNTTFDIYVTGLPLLVPAYHLRRFLARREVGQRTIEQT
jgi:hypothetical protein